MVLSLQGCMAAGKTTALNYLRENAPYVNVSYEENSEVVQAIRNRILEKNKYEDYLEIQRLWLDNEVRRFERVEDLPCTVMDFGVEEIEFHTINFPKAIGNDWDIENALKDELVGVRKCMPARILFLDASDDTLRQRKQSDPNRARSSFEYYLKHLMPLKRTWFSKMSNVDYLLVDNMPRQEVAMRVKQWVDLCIASYS
ncbi:hypothetical protein ACTQV1_01530 [Paratractidigestivibacter faecalis]|uniref:hypothetical protein n=1 Tax=Paratractidigestivibacter faecalis TaxID=2292441 RepID=UPI003F972C6A